MPQRNNTLIATAFIALAFLAAIPMDWSTTITSGSDLTVTGRTGHLGASTAASLPIWLLLCGSAAVTAVAGLNYIRATAVPFLLLAVILLGAGGYYALPFFAGDDPMQGVAVRIGAGPFVAMAATFASLLLAFRRPVPPSRAKPRAARKVPRHAPVFH